MVMIGIKVINVFGLVLFFEFLWLFMKRFYLGNFWFKKNMEVCRVKISIYIV